GIATAARTLAPDAMRAVLAPVARFLAGCGAPVLHYKCCSTFDSAPEVGSIGVAVRVLQAALRNPLVPIVGGQPSLGRYCVFGQLFASAGAEAVYRIDRHPTMSRHPVTPMHEADLARHLALQGLQPVAAVDAQAHEGDAPRWAVAADASAPAPQAVLFDVARDAHLKAIGEWLWAQAQAAPLLAVGASSVAQALIDAWGLSRQAKPSAVAPARGPVLALAGSLSPLSARQVAAASSYRRVPLDAARLSAGDVRYQEETVALMAQALAQGQHVLAHTAPLPGTGAAAPSASPALAAACGQLLKRVLGQVPVTRVGVAGGDTSSFAVQALQPWALGWLGSLSPGVALCRAHADDPRTDGLELMLKGGQMGPEDLFERLIAGTG
ncbi:MAG TPA: four-carbon acid sugar kinase family protein, partial [Ideonella sp.]|nr:four-carbon acid sugar kinase family protein [Ideonella sp.]